ncbi:MAG TPA: hypothetical protein VHM02_03650 [Thermoanaerobaculia bacterium]|nr:hypothetical protein [Thermoanaerobaculia bacterium]
MIADYTDDPFAEEFEELVLGTSTDGVHWTWEDFLNTDHLFLEMHSPVMVADPTKEIICGLECHGHSYWWGFFNFNTPTTAGTGRMKVDVSTAYPRGFRVHILSGGVWQQVDDSTGFVNFAPDAVWPGVFSRSLMWNVDHWELWGYKNVSPNGCAPCSGGFYDNFGAGSTFTYRQVAGINGSLGAPQGVFSNIRCMPSDHPIGRLYPFRVNGPSGRRFLYSTTNDANACKQLFNPFQGTYVVVTEVSN